MKNIILVGIMGCGKTTISKLLSENLKMPVFDMDKYIDKKYFAGTAHQKTGRKFFGGKRDECIGDKNIVNWQVLLC